MTAHDKDDSQARPRRAGGYSENDLDRNAFVHLSERVTELEVKLRMVEKQHVRDIEAIERRMKEDLEEVKLSVRTEVGQLRQVTSSLDKSAQAVSIAIAEIKVRSGIIGAISSGVTFFLIMAFEWLKQKAK